MIFFENIQRAGRTLGLLLKRAANDNDANGFALLAGTGVPAGATYGEQTLETNQCAIAHRANATDIDAEWYITKDGGTSWTALKPGASAWYTGTVTTPSAPSDAGVHAGVAASAANAFPGPFTNPDVPRGVKLVFGVGWDGGDVLLTGTSGLGAAQTETITSPGAGGGTVYSTKVWTTVTAATKGAIGASPATCSIGRAHKLAVNKAITAVGGIVTCDDAEDAVAWDRTNSAFSPSNLPNGARTYRYAVIG